jgi:RNA polymerase sigma factor (sigma-70 family)
MSNRGMEASVGLERLFRLGTTAGMSDSELLDRFVAGEREDAVLAFEALVERHGPLVRRVCRTQLRNVCDAEDAFQATFLVLARKARVLRTRELLSGWLYGVASRTARKAKITAARRHAREQWVARERSTVVASRQEDDRVELEKAVHEEIERLPTSYRTAVVACYLEGMTQAQAARQLRLNEATVRGRLERARKLLRHRLNRRGMTLSAAIDSSGPALSAVAERLSAPVASTTARMAFEFVNPCPLVPGTVSATVQGIANGVLLSMSIPSVKSMASAVLAAGMLIGGAGVIRRDIVEARLQSPSITPRGTEAIFKPAAAIAAAPTTPSKDPAQPPSNESPGATQSVLVTPELAKIVADPIVRATHLSKDCMILSYLPDWAFGNVDNIGIGNNGGGVRTLLDWPEIPQQEADAPDRRFVVALYARQTISHPPAGRIHAFAIHADWSELTSWKTKPAYDPNPAISSRFVPGTGWKLFDVTPIVRQDAKAGRKGNGALLRFLNEDFAPRGDENFSDYKFVSREGAGEWADRRPLLLIIKSSKRGFSGS